ncbi:MAG: glycosyltransferase [Eubacteriales bacterium]|nr:glycosyltransferase [Eubacteriales bacterium]
MDSVRLLSGIRRTIKLDQIKVLYLKQINTMRISMLNGYDPLVSIIIPVYNGSNYLTEAIESALAQTYKNIEILVINDGSNDNNATENIALSYGDKIRYYSKSNGGVSSALNLGISKMRGEYFSWLSHDDKYTPEKIMRQIEQLRDYDFNENHISYCLIKFINSESKYINKLIQKNYLLTGRKYNGISVISIMLRHGTFNGCAFLIHRSVFEKCGNLDESLRYNQDADMWYRIFLKNYNLIYVDYIGVLSRVHNNQLTQTGRTLFHSDSEKSSKYHISSFKEHSTKENNLLYLYARRHAINKNQNVVNNCIVAGKDANILNLRQISVLKVYCWYGNIRPYIRKIYHRLVYNVKTSVN